MDPTGQRVWRLILEAVQVRALWIKQVRFNTDMQHAHHKDSSRLLIMKEHRDQSLLVTITILPMSVYLSPSWQH